MKKKTGRGRYPRFVTDRANRRWSMLRAKDGKGYILTTEEPGGEIGSPTLQAYATRTEAEQVLQDIANRFEASGNKVTWEVPIR